MSEQAKNAPVGYGYATDEQRVSPFNFGGNFGVTKLTKFEWIPNAGKDGAEQEALDIVFNINGQDKSYRMFPVVKAFGKNQEEITDPSAPEFQDAVIDFNARVTHILHCYLEADAIKAAMARPIASFKEFCEIAMSLLPKNYNEQLLDIFLQYQWALGEKERTYLEIPTKMKQGRWITPAVAPIGGEWKKTVIEGASDENKKALFYVDGAGNEHPFFKNGWFMNNNYAKQQTSANAEASAGAAVATSEAGATNAKQSTW